MLEVTELEGVTDVSVKSPFTARELVLFVSVSCDAEAVWAFPFSVSAAQPSDLPAAIVTVTPPLITAVSPATGNALPPQVVLLFQFPVVVAVRLVASAVETVRIVRPTERRNKPVDFFISDPSSVQRLSLVQSQMTRMICELYLA